MITAYSDDVFTVRLQEGNEQFPYFLHVNILKWDRRTYLHAVHVFEAIKERLLEQGLKELFCGVPLNDLKKTKFVEIFGWERTEYVEIKPESGTTDGIWVLNIEDEL